MGDQQHYLRYYVYITSDGFRYYIGKRQYHGDIYTDSYMGSHSDKTYIPKYKEILTECVSAKQAEYVESKLLRFFDVLKSDLFVNRCIYIPDNSLLLKDTRISESMKAKISATVKNHWLDGRYSNRKSNSEEMKQWHKSDEAKLVYKQIKQTHINREYLPTELQKNANKSFYKNSFGKFTEEECRTIYDKRQRTMKINNLDRNIPKMLEDLMHREDRLHKQVNSKGGKLRANQEANLLKGVQRLIEKIEFSLVELKRLKLEMQGNSSS